MESFKNFTSQITEPVLHGLLVAIFCGAVFGYGTGIIQYAYNSYKLNVDFTKHTNNFYESFMSTSVIFGAFIGSPIFGFISDRKGRRTSLSYGAAVSCLGVLLSIISDQFWVVVIGRFIFGLSIGAMSSTGPLYLSEMTPDSIRGTAGVFFQFSITFTIFLAAFGAFFDPTIAGASEAWRYMIGVTIFPILGLVFLVGMIPESPRYLVGRDRSTALKLFKEIFGSDELAESEYKVVEEKTKNKAGFKDVMDKQFLKPILIGVILSIAQQWTGINAIIYYFSKITSKAYAAVLIMGWNCVMSMVSIPLTNIAGRRTLLFIGQAIMTLSLLVAGLAYLLPAEAVEYVVILAIVAFIAGFEISVGPLFFVVINEIFPENVRGVIGSVMTGLQWLCNTILTLTFPYLLEALGNSGGIVSNGYVFYIFSAVSFLSLVAEFFILPETKGKSLDEIQKLLE